MGIKDWSTTDANNDYADTANSINWPENIDPGLVNNSARAMMTQIKKWWDEIDGGTYSSGTVGGTGNAHTLTFSPTVQTLNAGMRFSYLAPGSSTGAVTLNVDGQGAKALQWRGAALASGDISSGDLVVVQYDGTQFQLILPPRLATFAPASTYLNSLTTDTTGGATGDFLPFVDASESNAPNKVTADDLIKNILQLLATTTVATGDFIPFVDVSDSNSGKKLTVDNLFITGLQLLTTDATLGDVADYVLGIDVSDSNNANKALVSDFLYNALNSATADTAPDMAADHVLSRDNSASAVKKVLMQYIGAGKQTVWIPAGAMTARTTNGAASGTTESTTNKVMNKTLDFDTTTQEFAQFNIAMPKSWNLGTVTFIPIWTAASGSGGVVFGLAGVALSNDDAIDTTFGTAQISTDTLITALDVHVGPESSAITIAGTPAQGDIVYFQLNRTVSDGSDTLGVDAKLIGIQLIFTTSVNTDN